MPKKDTYRLRVMLTVRESNKKQAEIELARSFKALEDEKKQLKKLEEEKQALIRKKEEARQDMANKMFAGENSILESKKHLAFIQRLNEEEEEKDKEIEIQQDEVKRAEARVSRCRSDYIEACRQLQVMEKHKELWKKKLAQEREKAEAKEMNELGNVLHEVKKRRGF